MGEEGGPPERVRTRPAGAALRWGSAWRRLAHACAAHRVSAESHAWPRGLTLRSCSFGGACYDNTLQRVCPERVTAASRGRGALGLRMCDLLRPGLRWVLMSNYMIDINWQVKEAPVLLEDGLRVVIVHGDRHPEECGPSSAFARGGVS